MVMIKTMGFKWQKQKQTNKQQTKKQKQKSLRELNFKKKGKEGKQIFIIEFKEIIVTTGILI
jgi:hypothetical protein